MAWRDEAWGALARYDAMGCGVMGRGVYGVASRAIRGNGLMALPGDVYMMGMYGVMALQGWDAWG